MVVESVPVETLRPHPRNYRVHTPEQLDHLRRSIEQHGLYRAIVVARDYTVLAGHGVTDAARALGYRVVPVVKLDVAPDDTRAIKVLVGDNEIARAAEIDSGRLVDLLRDIHAIGDLLGSGFSDDDFRALVLPEPTVGRTDPDAVPVERATSIQRGDVFTLGRHRLVCGDANDGVAIADASLARVDLVLTDPPYGIDLDTDWSDLVGSLGSIGAAHHTHGKTYRRVTGDDAPFDPRPLFDTYRRTASEMFLFGADYYADRIPERLDGSWLVWDKRKPSQADAIGAEFELIWSRRRHKRRILRHDWFGFLSSDNGAEARDRVHPTQKPTSLLRDILGQWSTLGAVVADPYLGSGSTLIACEQTGRTCAAIEIEPAYCQVTIDRWEAFTGQRACKV